MPFGWGLGASFLSAAAHNSAFEDTSVKWQIACTYTEPLRGRWVLTECFHNVFSLRTQTAAASGSNLGLTQGRCGNMGRPAVAHLPCGRRYLLTLASLITVESWCEVSSAALGRLERGSDGVRDSRQTADVNRHTLLHSKLAFPANPRQILREPTGPFWTAPRSHHLHSSEERTGGRGRVKCQTERSVINRNTVTKHPEQSLCFN